MADNTDVYRSLHGRMGTCTYVNENGWCNFKQHQQDKFQVQHIHGNNNDYHWDFISHLVLSINTYIFATENKLVL